MGHHISNENLDRSALAESVIFLRFKFSLNGVLNPGKTVRSSNFMNCDILRLLLMRDASIPEYHWMNGKARVFLFPLDLWELRTTLLQIALSALLVRDAPKRAIQLILSAGLTSSVVIHLKMNASGQIMVKLKHHFKGVSKSLQRKKRTYYICSNQLARTANYFKSCSCGDEFYRSGIINRLL